MEPNELTSLVLVPLAIAVINIFIPSIIRKTLTLLGLLYGLFLVYQLYGNSSISVHLFGETILAMDKIAYLTMAFIQILSVIILIFSLKGIDKSIEKGFFVLYPFTVSCRIGVVLSTH